MTYLEPEKGLISGVEELDLAFPQGIPKGKMVEWGVPPGSFGRIFPVSFVRQFSGLCLWVIGSDEKKVLASSFASRGVDLRRIYFAHSAHPLQDLRAVFEEKAFGLVVLDEPKYLREGDMAFLLRHVRSNGQILFVIRPFYLSTKRGNPWASYRINVRMTEPGLFSFSFIKGGANKWKSFKGKHFALN